MDPAPDAYGEHIADVYDLVAPTYAYLDADVEAARLAELAGEGPVLELGIGTGRVAVPLAKRGPAVYGIDSSQAMLQRLRAKPEGAEIVTAHGDMADVDIAPGVTFTLAFAAFHTFFCLIRQSDQIRCFANVAARLAPGGRFVIDAFVPELGSFVGGQRVRVAGLTEDCLSLAATLHDPLEQRIRTQCVFVLADGRIRMAPWNVRYAWPSELDLMARLAGLELEHQWEDFKGTPLTASSTRRVGVYRKPEAPR
jgi:SAM-dependent methyltransferase